MIIIANLPGALTVTGTPLSTVRTLPHLIPMRMMLLLSHLAGKTLIREPAQSHRAREQRIQTQVV